MPSPSLQLRARAELERRRRERDQAAQQPETFAEFVDLVRPGFRWHRPARVMAAAVQRLVDGEIPKLFIAAPPQLGKSEIAKLAVAYRLRRRPDLWVGASSYGASLSNKISRWTRDYYQRAGGRLRDDAGAVETWQLPAGGGMWAYGVGGGQTGNPANFLLLDDPVKNPQEAASPVFQERNRVWYDTAFRSRWNPYGGPLLELMIGTRWDVKDLLGYALDQGGWHCVILAAIYPHEPIEVPAGNTLEPDWREPGEPLAPELDKFNLPALEAEKVKLKRRFWALYQQQPQPDEGGGIFRNWWFQRLAQDPAERLDPLTGLPVGESVYAASCRAWDLAATDGGGDPTTGVKSGRLRETGRIVVRDVVIDRVGPGGMKRLMAQTMIADGPKVAVWFPTDPGQAGVFQAAELSHFLRQEAARAGMACPRLLTDSVRSSKAERARLFAAAAEPVDKEGRIPGNVDVVEAPWTADYVEELHLFDGVDGHADDQVDASCDAYRVVTAAAGTEGWYTG
jgi:predicted phage terminase large subunit-like protein